MSQVRCTCCMRDHRSLPCCVSLLCPLCLAGTGSTQARNLEMDGETPLNGSHHFDTATATSQEYSVLSIFRLDCLTTTHSSPTAK